MHVHQFVKVSVSATKTEIGVIVALRGDEADVATRHGFNVTAKLGQLQRVFLLVLDLNGVLVARQKQKFVKRPFVDEFIKFALANFVVAVWSSCEERNGKHIVEDVFGGLQDRLLFQMYRPDCRPFPTAERPYGTIKDLQKIFDKYPESFNALTTIIVDDSPDKCSHPDIALCPPPFAVSDTGEVISDGEKEGASGLAGTMDVLRMVLCEDNVSPLIDAAARRIDLLEQRAQLAAAAVGKPSLSQPFAPAAVASGVEPAALVVPSVSTPSGGPGVSTLLQQLLLTHPQASMQSPPTRQQDSHPQGESDVMSLFKKKFSEAALKELQATSTPSSSEAPPVERGPLPRAASSAKSKEKRSSRNQQQHDHPESSHDRSGNIVSILRNAQRVQQQQQQ